MLKHAFTPAVNGGGPCAYIGPGGSDLPMCNLPLLADVHLSSNTHLYTSGPEVGRCIHCGGSKDQHPTMETVPLPACLVCSNCRNSLYDGLECYDIYGSDEGTGHQTVGIVWCAPHAIQRVLRIYQRKHGRFVLQATKVEPAIYGDSDLREWEAVITKETAIAEGIKTSEKALEAQRKLIKERWGV